MHSRLFHELLWAEDFKSSLSLLRIFKVQKHNLETQNNHKEQYLIL